MWEGKAWFVDDDVALVAGYATFLGWDEEL